MKVLMVEPKEAAYEAEIGGELKDMKNAVGGYIQAVFPYEEPVALVCNEEGKIDGLPLNHSLRDESGNVYDIIAGTFFICGLSEDNFDSLSPDLMEKFKSDFHDPEMFKRINGKILAVKVTEQYIETHGRLHDRHDRER